MSDYFEIGKIVNTQGLKGEVRVMPCTDDPKRFELLETVEVCTGKTGKQMELEGVRYNKAFVIIKFKGIDDINDAEKLKNAVIRIPEALALPLEENEYYIRDLYGINVVTDEGEALGELTNIIETGANDVYVIQGDSAGRVKEILIPAIKSCILDVDIKSKIMTIKIPEGLVD